MIRVYTVTAPLGELDPDTSVAALQTAAEKLTRRYPALRDTQVLADQGVLTLSIKISSRDQWACGAAARKVGTSLLSRLGIPAEHGSIDLDRTMPSARSLTRQQGRIVTRGPDAPPAAPAAV